MANPEHLAKLKEGVEAWNEWVSTDVLLRPDLSGADLGHASLAGYDFRHADLSSANLFDADLREALLSNANLNGANLYGANLRTPAEERRLQRQKRTRRTSSQDDE